MATRRPSMFIGSSAEGLKLAKALQVNLDRVCETVIWSQGLFGLSNGTLEELVRKAPEFDFASLLLTPDDLTTSREHQHASPRDNVVFEAGLFMGVLGRGRTFLVYDRAAKPKLPSDLAGITLADYELHTTGNLQASIGAASTQIEEAVKALRLREDERLKADITTGTQFQIISDLLDKSVHQFLILMSEQNLSLRRESPFGDGIAYVYSLFNKAGGRGFFSVSKMCELLPDAGLLQPDLRQNIQLTSRGHEFARWLIERGCKAVTSNLKGGHGGQLLLA